MTAQELLDRLTAAGWRIGPNPFPGAWNEADWIGYKRSSGGVECECNEGRPVQIVVEPMYTRPHHFATPLAPTLTVSITGEAGGIWHRIDAYGVSPDDFLTRAAEIECGLVAAWNVLPREVAR